MLQRAEMCVRKEEKCHFSINLKCERQMLDLSGYRRKITITANEKADLRRLADEDYFGTK